MTNKPKPTRKPTPPKPVRPSGEADKSKPYQFVSIPQGYPDRKHPAGHNQLNTNDYFTGQISLKLTVKTPTFIASGLVAMGSDLSQMTKNIPLIKVAINQENKLLIPGSSLKGVVRSVYEAITKSCICKTKARNEQIPHQYNECKEPKNLCPACRVFGAMGWQGLLNFNDCIADEIKPSVGLMPSLYSPRSYTPIYKNKGKVAGRKFYYHTIKAVDKGKQGIPVQQAKAELTFITKLGFRNLKIEELGALLIVLGQDKYNSFALKIGGGKPIGMGTMTVEITEINCPQKLNERYLNYDVSTSEILEGELLQKFINNAIRSANQNSIIRRQQLEEIKNILKYPTDRQPPEGMY